MMLDTSRLPETMARAFDPAGQQSRAAIGPSSHSRSSRPVVLTDARMDMGEICLLGRLEGIELRPADSGRGN